MKPIHQVLGQLHDFLIRNFGSMRHRIPAATLPYTRRTQSRKHDRIASLIMKGYWLFFVIAVTCAMSRKYRLVQGFLATFLNRSIA